ncbi:hypothetical protein L7F22_067499 [Adiantum nelumboides]|nr:hypothetical protein [Adiantum nelumboides]
MVTFLHEKSSGSVLKTFKTYHRLVENQPDLRITALQTDNGGEYTSHVFEDYCRKPGIHHRYTVAHNPQQNGLAERKNRTLMASARSMLKVAALPPPFWEEAVATACYLQNRTYSRSIDAIPYTLWIGQNPAYDMLRIFGCVEFYMASTASPPDMSIVASPPSRPISL